MPCYHPLRASRTRSGQVLLGKEQPDSEPLSLPCGNCIGCKTANARAWALRCHLELHRHKHAAFTTLTYNERTLPPTLQKRDLQLFFKRLRKSVGATRSIRFFGCGEYGEQNKRPHYHAIIFGLSKESRDVIEKAWGLGITHTVNATPATIAYTAGYTAKKLGKQDRATERVDPETGEVFRWQPPFLQMSRRPGIGGHAREHINSWRSFAIHNGNKVPVPRFLHEAWKQTATPLQIEELLYEKQLTALTRNTTKETLKAAEKDAITRQQLRRSKRKI